MIKIFRKLSLLLVLITVAVLYQNCSDVKLAPLLAPEKLSCDPSVYDISRDITATNGHAVYFLRQNNRDISKEYSEQIEWFIDDVLQSENIIHDNRLFLECNTHSENIRVKARFKTDCGDDVEKVEDFSYPIDICEPQNPPVEPPEESPLTYCEEYKAKYPGVENEPGFKTTLIERRMPFHSMFYTISMQRWVFGDYGIMDEDEYFSGTSPYVSVNGSIGLPGMLGQYLTIPIHIPESAPDMILKFAHVETQGGYGVAITGVRSTISPCPGDFRSSDLSALGQDKAEFFSYNNRFTQTGAKKIYVSNDPNFYVAGGVRIPKGKTVYWNFSNYSFSNFIDYGGYECPDVEPIDEEVYRELYAKRLRKWGCGLRWWVDRGCYDNGERVACPGELYP